MKIKTICSSVLALCIMLCAVGCGEPEYTTSEIWVDGEDVTSVIEGQNGYYSDGTDATGSGKGNNGGGSSGGKTSQGGQAGKNGLGGATVVYATWGGSPVPAATSPTYSSYTKKVKEIEKKYNCKLDYKVVINAVEYKNAFTSAAMSGIKYADIVHLGSGWVYPQHLRNGFLHPLDDYIDLDDVGWDQNPMKQSVVNGKHYILFTANNFNGIGGIFYNKSVFKKFGVKDPSTYVAGNNWNTKTFLDVAKATTGTKDGVQYYGFTLSKAGIATWGNIFGGKQIQKLNGKYVYEPDAKFIAGIQYAHDLTNEHKVTGAGWDQGRVAMIAGYTYDGKDVAANIGGENVGWTYLPKGPGQSDYYCAYSSSECYGIPSAAKNPEILANIMVDYIYPSKTGNTVEAKLEGYFYDETSYNTAVQAIKKAQRTSELSPTYSFISTNIGWNDFGLANKKSPQQYIASVKAQAQAELDEVWQQK